MKNWYKPMTPRECFEWDNANTPQAAVKDGRFNPEYSKWLEDEVERLGGVIEYLQKKIK